ncbi:MAG: hypothetical protein U0L88_09515 [Acutalibacteraceae bacterium]|nr:hypothetical protein [Acutalibacteraceae bacterium]
MVEWKVKGLYKADAETVYREITSLGDSFSPADIVEAARDESSELHKCFEWRDEVAAEKYREHQARMIITQLVVRTETSDNTPVSVRVISSANEVNTYVPTKMLIKSDSDYADLLARAKRELQAFQQKYSTLSELQEIFTAIDAL